MRKSLLVVVLWILSKLAFAQLPADSTSGVYKTYYNSGKIQMKGRFKNGVRNGSFYYFAEDGKLLKQEIYHKGKLNWTYFFNDHGRVIRKIDKKGKVTTKPDCGCT
ncbi:MAG: hypothetical protein K1X81_08425 [Bacteroidia bacterium]|nr:hypothetical protein [Bacteroidia bacterium]